MNTEIKTIDQAKELLISLYKREIDNTEFYQTQTKFDDYVSEFCKVSEIEIDDISDEQLSECAFNFVEYDGGEYLLKKVGCFTTTEGRQATEMLEGKWTSLQEPQQAYNILQEYIEDDELNEEDRWFDIEIDVEGRKFATSGTVDLEYYIQIYND